MKTPSLRKTIAIGCLLLLPTLTQATLITLKTADASGTTSFTGSTNWSNGAIPGAGNDYSTYTSVVLNQSGMRTPPDALNYTFGGNSLTLTNAPAGGYSLIEKSTAGSGAGRTLTINNLTNAWGGLLRSGGTVGSIITVTGNVFCVSGNSTLTADQCNWIINSPLAGTGVLTNNFANSQTLTLGGTNSAFAGKLLINGITLFSAPYAVPGNPVVALPDQIILGSGGTLRDNVGITLNNANGGVTLYGNATVNTVNAGTNTTIAEPIAGAFLLTKSGSGTLTLTGPNTFSGGLTLSGGNLNLNNAGAPGTGTLTFNTAPPVIDNTSGAALTLLNNNAQAWNTNFTFNGTASLNLGGGAVTMNASRTVTVVSNNLTVGGPISGATFSLTKAGGGALTLAGNNTFSGGFTLSGATAGSQVNINSTTALGTGTFTINSGDSGIIDNTSGSALTLSANNPQTWNNNFTFAGSSDLNLGAGAVALGGNRTLTINSHNLTVGGIISGADSITKVGGGTLTLNGNNAYTGNTIINGGTLALGASGSLSTSPAITVASGATFDVTAVTGAALGSSQSLSGNGAVNGNFTDSSGSQIYPGGSGTVGTLTFNNNLAPAGGDTFNFDFNGGSNDVVVVGGNLSPGGTTTLNLASGANALTNGNYVLFRVAGSLGGSLANFVIAGVPSPSRQTFALVENTASSPKTIVLQVAGTAANLVWKGGLNGNFWDITTTYNWLNGASSDVFFGGDNVTFSDAGAASQPVLNVTVLPGSVTFNSSSNYNLTGAGNISGGAGLTKSGGGTLTIGTVNGYTGVTTLGGGTVSVSTIANSGTASALGAASAASGNLVFNGGTLQYTGPTASTDHGATLGAGGGTVALGNSGVTLTLGGPIVGNSGGALTKTGNDTLVLGGANTYNGATTIAAGTLQVGAGGATGSLGTGTITDNGALVFDTTGNLTLSNTISGIGGLTQSGTGIVALTATNSFAGGLLVNTGTVQVVSAASLGQTPATFNPGQITLDGGTLEASGTFSLNDTNTGINVVLGTIAVDASNTLTIANILTSPTTLVKALPGTLILTGSNNLAGTLDIDTASATASDGAVDIASTNALSQVTDIYIRNNQAAASSTLQLDGTAGSQTLTQNFTWSGRNNTIAALDNLAGSNVWNPGSVTFVVGGTYYPIQCDAGTLNLAASFPTTVPTTGRTILFEGNGYIPVTGSIGNGSGGGFIAVTKTNNGVLTYWGGNSYSGLTSIQGGVLNVADYASFGVSTTNMEVAPYAGATATINISNATVTAQRVIIAGITGNNSTAGTGIINQFNGTINASQWFTVGSGGAAGGAGTFNMSGGTLNVQNTAGGTQMEIANFVGSTGTVNLSGTGQINIMNNAYISLGANTGAGNGTFNQSGGAVTFSGTSGAVGGTGLLYLGKATGLTNTYTYNLNGGTLTVPEILSASGASLFYFNGGTLMAAETNAVFMNGLTDAYVSAGGAIIDDGGFAVTIGQALTHDPALGATVDGGLTKLDSGSLTLAGTNTYTGATKVNNGALLVNGSLGTGAVTVNGGTLGGLGVVNGPTTLSSGSIQAASGSSIGNLTINNSLAVQGGTLLFQLNTLSNDLVTVSGAVNITGATTVQLTFPVPGVGTYTLLSYGSLNGFGNLSLVLTVPNPRYTFTLVNDTTAKAIKVVVTGVSLPLVWKGDGSFNGWDNAGSYENWLNGSTPNYFYDGDSVTFNDSGSSTPSIYLTTTVSPASVTVNSTHNYDFAGSGLIAGPGGLVKSGSGTLTLEDNNTYSGATLINGGTVQVGAGNASGSLGTGATTNNATLVFDRSDAITLASPIYGTGSVTINAPGTVTASGSNYYTGSTLLNSGITYLQNAAGFGNTNGGISVISGAQLYITLNFDVGAAPLTLVGTGDGNGALRKGGAGVTTYYGGVTLAGDTTLSVDSGATLNLAGASGINGALANANLTLAGSGTATFSGPLQLAAGGLTVNSGSWTLGPSNNFSGLTTVNAGTLGVVDGTLGKPAVFNPAQITFAGGRLLAVTNATFNDGLAGFTLNANTIFAVAAGSALNISNNISGGATLIKSSPGTLTLSGSNAFTGILDVDTATNATVNDGATRIASPDALANVPVSPGTATILEQNNNSAYSTFQLDGTAGAINVAQEISLDCRNTANANIENIAGSNTISGNIDVQVGGGNLYFQSDSGILNLAGTVQYVGTLTGGRIYNFTGAGNHLVSGTIINSANGAPISVAMSGTGTLTLAGANTYGNTTTIAGGTTLVTGSISSSGGVTVTGGSLGGPGVINDNVSVAAGGTLAPGVGGNTLTTLTINSNLALAGNVAMDVSKTGHTSDLITGVQSLTYGGTLSVTNRAGTLVLGDHFTLFSAATVSSNFTAVVGNPGPGLAYSFNSANGVVTVVTGIASNPTNITASVNGATLNLSWPADHIGWILQSQTNSLGDGLDTNWVDITGSGAGTSVSFSINPAKPTVFFRLRHP
jgi:autotransporter-associated beta strand protein